jgi:hypothetical protein
MGLSSHLNFKLTRPKGSGIKKSNKALSTKPNPSEEGDGKRRVFSKMAELPKDKPEVGLAFLFK